MNKEMIFKQFLAQYCSIEPKDMKDDMKFAEDLGLSSFDFMSLLGDLEDNFDVELNIDNIGSITTIGEAIKFISGEKKTA